MATPTMMSTEVPPNAWTSELPVNQKMIDGTTARTAIKRAPGRVTWSMVLLMYAAVAAPGRTPGMKPPCLRS